MDLPGSTSGSWWPEVLSGCQDVLIEFESCDNIIISFIIYWTTCYRYSAQRKFESVEGSSQVNILCNSYLIQSYTNTFHLSLLISCLKCRLIIPHFRICSPSQHRHVRSLRRPGTNWLMMEGNLGCLSQPGSGRRWRSIDWTGLGLIMLYNNTTSSLSNWS